jgi:hypothetical protein
MAKPSTMVTKASLKTDYVAAHLTSSANLRTSTWSRPGLNAARFVAHLRPTPKRRTYLALALAFIGGLPLTFVAVPADTARAVVRTAPGAEPISVAPWTLRTKLQHRLGE